jgi:hypothetical protein
MQDSAWRFNKYAERAREAEHVWPDDGSGEAAPDKSD